MYLRIKSQTAIEQIEITPNKLKLIFFLVKKNSYNWIIQCKQFGMFNILHVYMGEDMIVHM